MIFEILTLVLPRHNLCESLDMIAQHSKELGIILIKYTIGEIIILFVDHLDTSNHPAALFLHDGHSYYRPSSISRLLIDFRIEPTVLIGIGYVDNGRLLHGRAGHSGIIRYAQYFSLLGTRCHLRPQLVFVFIVYPQTAPLGSDQFRSVSCNGLKDGLQLLGLALAFLLVGVHKEQAAHAQQTPDDDTDASAGRVVDARRSQSQLSLRQAVGGHVELRHGRVDDPTGREAGDVADALAKARRRQRGQTKGDADGIVDEVSGLDHDDVVHESEAHHGDGTSEGNYEELTVRGFFYCY